MQTSPAHRATSPALVSPLLPAPAPCQALSTSQPCSHHPLCPEGSSTTNFFRSLGRRHLLQEAPPDHQPLSFFLTHSPELDFLLVDPSASPTTEELRQGSPLSPRPSCDHAHPNSPPAGRSSAVPGPGPPAAAGTGIPAAAGSAAGRRAAAAGRGAGSCGLVGTGPAKGVAPRPAPSAPLGARRQ